MMAPKTSKSQVGADFGCGWGKLSHMRFVRYVISDFIRNDGFGLSLQLVVELVSLFIFKHPRVKMPCL